MPSTTARSAATSRRLRAFAPGMLLDYCLTSAPRAELPAGAYTLRVGLYPPGAPDSPLLPAASDLPYVQGGQVEVRP